MPGAAAAPRRCRGIVEQGGLAGFSPADPHGCRRTTGAAKRSTCFGPIFMANGTTPSNKSIAQKEQLISDGLYQRPEPITFHRHSFLPSWPGVSRPSVAAGCRFRWPRLIPGSGPIGAKIAACALESPVILHWDNSRFAVEPGLGWGCRAARRSRCAGEQCA